MDHITGNSHLTNVPKMMSAISSYGLEKRVAGGEAVDVGVGVDSGGGK